MGFVAPIVAGAGAFLGSAGGQAALSLGTQALSTGLGVIGAKKSAKGQAQQYLFAAQQARDNALTARLAGGYEESSKRMETTANRASAVAAAAANGVEARTGSAAAVQQSIQTIGDLDAAMIHYNAAREAFGEDQKADLYLKAAKGAKKKGLFDVASTLLGGATSLADKWGTFQQSGALGGGSSSGGLGNILSNSPEISLGTPILSDPHY